MGTRFLNNVDFDLNQALKLKLENLSYHPSPSESRIYYNTTEDCVCYYNGASWVFLRRPSVKPSVATFADLPTTDLIDGDSCYVIDEDKEYFYNLPTATWILPDISASQIDNGFITADMIQNFCINEDKITSTISAWGAIANWDNKISVNTGSGLKIELVNATETASGKTLNAIIPDDYLVSFNRSTTKSSYLTFGAGSLMKFDGHDTIYEVEQGLLELTNNKVGTTPSIALLSDTSYPEIITVKDKPNFLGYIEITSNVVTIKYLKGFLVLGDIIQYNGNEYIVSTVPDFNSAIDNDTHITTHIYVNQLTGINKNNYIANNIAIGTDVIFIEAETRVALDYDNISLNSLGLDTSSTPLFEDVLINGLTTSISSTNSVQTQIESIGNTFDITKEPTGFPNRTDTSITQIVTSNRQFTITGTNFNIYIHGKKYIKNTETITVPNITQLNYIYYNSSGVLSQSTTFWDLAMTIPVAVVYYNTVLTSGIVGDERHGLTMDYDTHKYLHLTIGARYQSGLSASYGNTSFTISSGTIFDEDIQHDINTQTQTRVFYRNGTRFDWTSKQNLYYYTSGGHLYYDNASTPTAVSNNEYVAYWCFATNNPETPIIHIMGQRKDITLANARNNNTYESLVLTGLPFAEYKVLYRILIRDVASFEEIQDLRNVSPVTNGTYVATDHNSLTNRTATNSHPASAIDTVTTNFNKILTTSETDVQLALDKIDDHVHDNATTSVNGFMSASDKLKLDNVSSSSTPCTSTPLMNGIGNAGTFNNFSRGDHVHPTDTTKVDKITGKGLSTNDYTTAEQTKLSNIWVYATPCSSTPLMNGVASVGTYNNLSRGDHIHPSDTSKENTVTAGTTSQYYRGDKSWQTLDKNAVGLGNVDNTSDANKPVSTAQKTYIDAGDLTNSIQTSKGLFTVQSSMQANIHNLNNLAVDSFNDQTGLDAVHSANYVYDATNKSFYNSLDGETWTLRTTNGNAWNAIAYGNGIFVAVASSGSGNRVMTSTDGINWTARTSAENNSWVSVCYGNGLFVAVANAGNNRVMTSTDGITWTARRSATANLSQDKPSTLSSQFASDSGASNANNGLTGGNYQGGDKVAITNSTASPFWYVDLGAVYSIGDIEIWNRTDVAMDRLSDYYVYFYDNNFQNIQTISHQTTYPNPMTVVNAGGASGRYIVIQLSGTNYLQLAEVKVFEANSWANVCYGNGKYVAVSQTGVTRVMYSTDGITWKSRPIYNIARNGSAYQTSTDQGGVASRAVDGNTSGVWNNSEVTRTAGAQYEWWSVPFDDSYEIGNVKIWNRTDAYMSRLRDYTLYVNDGIGGYWSSHQTSYPNPSTTIDAGGYYGNSVSLQTNIAEPLSLAEVQVWTKTPFYDSIAWWSVCYGNGVFVAVAGDGANQVMTSTDGIRWTARTPSVANYWRYVCYGNGLFVAVATNGTNTRVMTSPDGITWTTRTSGANNTWSCVCYGANLYIAISVTGSGNRVMTSPDGITWTARTSAGDLNWMGICYGNGKFVAVSPDATANNVMTANEYKQMTLTSNIVTASATPNYGYTVVDKTLSTGASLTTYVSRNGGTSWDTVTEETMTSISGQSAGSSMAIKVATDADGHKVIVNAWALGWKV